MVNARKALIQALALIHLLDEKLPTRLAAVEKLEEIRSIKGLEILKKDGGRRQK